MGFTSSDMSSLFHHISKASLGKTDVLDVIRPLLQRPHPWFKPQFPSFTPIPTSKPHVFLCVPPAASIVIKEGFGVTLCIQGKTHIVDFSEHSQIFQGYPRTLLNWQALNQATFFLATSLIRGYCEPSISAFCKEIIQFQGIRLFQRSQENKHTFPVLKPLPPLNLSFLEYLHW